MKPEYVNTFGLRKVSDKQGEILEITLDASYTYMENTVTVTTTGLENIARAPFPCVICSFRLWTEKTKKWDRLGGPIFY